MLSGFWVSEIDFDPLGTVSAVSSRTVELAVTGLPAVGVAGGRRRALRASGEGGAGRASLPWCRFEHCLSSHTSVA